MHTFARRHRRTIMLSDGSVNSGPLVQPLGSAHTQSTPLVREPGWKPELHDLLFRPSSSPRAHRLHLGTSALIVVSTACFVCQSFASIHNWPLWTVLDVCVCIFFTARPAAKPLD